MVPLNFYPMDKIMHQQQKITKAMQCNPNSQASERFSPVKLSNILQGAILGIWGVEASPHRPQKEEKCPTSPSPKYIVIITVYK